MRKFADIKGDVFTTRGETRPMTLNAGGEFGRLPQRSACQDRHVRMKAEVPFQSFEEAGSSLRVIQNLVRDNAFETRRRISHAVRKVTLKGEQDRIEFLGFGDQHGSRDSTGTWSLSRATP
jgi:hypothetical protein